MTDSSVVPFAPTGTLLQPTALNGVIPTHSQVELAEQFTQISEVIIDKGNTLNTYVRTEQYGEVVVNLGSNRNELITHALPRSMVSITLSLIAAEQQNQNGLGIGIQVDLARNHKGKLEQITAFSTSGFLGQQSSLELQRARIILELAMSENIDENTIAEIIQLIKEE